MTQEEKAERYDEALNTAKDCLKDGTITNTAISYIESIFPELKEEIEDDRIRNWLEEHIEAMPDNSIEFKDVKRIDVLHWIEEQDKQKLNGTFVNVDDVREDFIDEIYRVLNADSTNDRANQIIDAFDSLPTVTIKQDPCKHCKMTYSSCYSFPCDEKKAFEQGKSALEAINEEKVDNDDKVVIKKGEKPTEWSEEDNVMIRCITLDLELLKNRDDGKAGKAAYQSEIEWLKSIKDRVGCEANCTATKEWSVEDMSKIQRICKYLDEAKKYYADITEVRECIDWLKSIKNRYAWKPSDEQMEAFEHFVKSIGESGYASPYENNTKLLYSLLEQLKKLK